MFLSRRMHEENVVICAMEYYSVIKTLKLTGKWKKLEKQYPELGIPEPERKKIMSNYQKKSPSASDEIKHRDPQSDIVHRLEDFGTLSALNSVCP